MHIIVKSTFNRRPITQMSTVNAFHRWTDRMRWTMPEHSLPFGIVKLDQLQWAIAFQRPIKIPQFTVDLGDDRCIGKTLTDSSSHGIRCGFPGFAGDHFAVGQRNVDVGAWLCGHFGIVVGLELVPETDAIFDERRRRTELLDWTKNNVFFLYFYLNLIYLQVLF